MARIAFALELGANYGHLSRTLPVADSLRAVGHTVRFAVHDLLTARSLLTPKGFGFVAAPRMTRRPLSNHRPANYGQILAEQGYLDRDSLRACLGAWLALWHNTDVDAIVINHAPTALLAARIMRKPVMLLGTGFSVPPDVEPLPSLRPWEAISLESLRQSDAALIESINDVVQEFGGTPLRRLADLFTGVPALLTTFAELDHYGPRSGMTFIGPTEVQNAGESVQWRSSNRPHVFAYLRTDMRSFETALAALKEFPAETICVIPDATASLLRRLRDCPIRIFSKPLNLDSLLRDAHAVVSYGGAGMVAQSLRAGVPMLVLTHVVEQYLSAQRVAELGAGILLDVHASVAGIRTRLQELLSSPGYRQAAQSFAQRYSSFDSALANKQAAEAIVHLAGRGQSKRDEPATEQSPARRSSPPQRRVLYAWELGANAGHLERGLAVAEALRTQGVDVVFAVRNLDLARRLLASRGFHYVGCPSAPPRPPQRAPVNYSDLLLECGFDDAPGLSARVHAWSELFQWMKPDLAVLDYAPTAQLAAYASGLPSVLVGSGFYIPPGTNPLPSIQPRKQITDHQLIAADQQLLQQVNHVAHELGASPLTQIDELFARSPQIVTTFPELDPYARRARGEHVGPVERATSHARTEWRTAGAIRVFAYLRPIVKHMDALFGALNACGVEAKCALPGVPMAAVRKYQNARVEIFTAPVELGSLLREADVVVSYGSAGLIAQSLLAGVPLLLLCDALEQINNSLRVVELGAGIAVIENRTVATLTEALRKLSSQASYRTAARTFAAKYRDREQNACERIVHAVMRSL